MKNKPSDISYHGVRKSVIDSAKPELNPIALGHLRDWIRERATIRKKKDILKEPAPWTDNPILRKIKFTNVKREHDPHTKWVIDNICHRYDIPLEIRLLNIIIYRIYNKSQTAEMIGMPFGQPLSLEQMSKIEAQFRDLDERGVTIFTNAFNTGGIKSSLGRSFSGGYIPMRVITFFNHLWEISFQDKLMEQKTPLTTLELLMSHKGIGEFLGYQMWVDFTYCDDYPWSENEFTVAGPGCMNGLDRLFIEKDEMTHEECLFWLRDNPHVLDIDWADLFDYMDDHDQCANVMSLENCFCELGKYIKSIEALEQGKRAPVRNKYDGEGKPTSILDLF